VPLLPAIPDVPDVPLVPDGVSANEAVPKNPTPFDTELVNVGAVMLVPTSNDPVMTALPLNGNPEPCVFSAYDAVVAYEAEVENCADSTTDRYDPDRTVAVVPRETFTFIFGTSVLTIKSLI
jgi:hypothetical protein